MRSASGTRLVATALAATLAMGCTSWRVQGISPQMVIAREQPRAVLVTRADGSKVVVAGPSIVGDTLWGEVDGRPRGLPVEAIASIAVRRGDGGRTAGLVLGLGVASLLGLAALIAATW